MTTPPSSHEPQKGKTPAGKILTAIFLLFSCVASTAMAQSLYYNSSGNPGWNNASGWSSVGTSGPFNQAWSDNNIANFGTPGNITVSGIGNFTATGLASSGSNFVNLQGLNTTLTINGNVSGFFSQGLNLSLGGNFTLTSGEFDLGGNRTGLGLVGTAGITGGNLYEQQNAPLSTSSNFLIGGGTFHMAHGGSATMGTLTINAGSVVIGRNSGAATNSTVTSLSGTGGGISMQSNGSTPFVDQLIVNQSSNTTYAGSINGSATNATLSLSKQGSGDLTLSGTISNLANTTTVSGGRLYINSSSTSFGDSTATTALQVSSGGNLGGTGTITTLAGDSVLVADGGKLTAGVNGTAGRTTYALGTGSSLDLSTVSGTTGWLYFDLGTDATAGTTYDQIRLTSGTLNIGSGLLNFDDFVFTALSGFGQPAVYTLFNDTAISGTLGSSLSGTISGYNAALSLSGNNILLTVVPEPATYMLLGIGFATVLLVRRRK